jgi:roadblock/LC7 domain-containing protein
MQHMTKLDDLLDIDGVMAAGVFTADGTLVEYKSVLNMSPEMAAMSAQFCATVSMMFSSLAGSFSHLTGMKCSPQQGWAYSGGEMSVAVRGKIGVFIRTDKADFNQLFEQLTNNNR